MDVQTEKIELAKRLLETDDEELLQQIKVVFENHHIEQNLPEHVKEGIQKSLQQASDGFLTSHDEVMKNYGRFCN